MGLARGSQSSETPLCPANHTETEWRTGCCDCHRSRGCQALSRLGFAESLLGTMGHRASLPEDYRSFSSQGVDRLHAESNDLPIRVLSAALQHDSAHPRLCRSPPETTGRDDL